MRLSLMLLVPLVACAPRPNPPVADVPIAPCRVAVSSEEVWREVSADGFTFCIPASWRPTSSNTFRGEGGWIRWGVGQYRPTATRTATVTVPAGQIPPTLPGRRNRFTESIGGSVVEIWDNELEGTFSTGAQWSQPRAIHLMGQSTDPAIRAQQLQIYRTVRFPGS